MLPHYLAKFKCSTVELYMIVIQFIKFDKSFIYSKYLQKYHVLDQMSVPISLQHYSMCSKYPPSARTHALRRARHSVNGCVDDGAVQCCAKRLAGAVAVYCADVKSDNVKTVKVK